MSPAPSLPSGPADCAVDNFDDRCEVWTDFYDGPSRREDTAGNGALFSKRTIVTSPDDSTVYVTGTENVMSTPARAMTVAYDTQTGVRRWTAIRGGPASEYPRALALSPDGRFLFVYSYRAQDAFLVSYDAATGSELWTTAYAHPAEGNVKTVATDVVAAAAPNGGTRVFAGGYVYDYDSGNGRQAWVAAFEVAADGSLLGKSWAAGLSGPEGTEGMSWALATSPHGSVVYQAGRGSRSEFAVVAYRAADGARLWVRYLRPNDNNAVNGFTEAVATADRVFVSGMSRAGIETMAFDLDGQLMWRQVHTRNLIISLAEGALAAAGGRVYITAEMWGYGDTDPGRGWTVAAYDDREGGVRVWQVDSLDRPGPIQYYQGFFPAITATPSGDRVFVTGPRFVFRASVAATSAYDGRTGQELWTARFIGRSSYPTTLTASRDGRRVFVTGTSFTADTYPVRGVAGASGDLMMLAYDA